MEEDWKHKSKGIASFKMLTIQCRTLWNKDVLCEGYRPNMLLYTLDELFYIYDQEKCHRGVNEKLVVAYEILSLTVLCCMECRGWVEKHDVLDAVLQVNLNNTHHLEYLTWAVCNRTLLVGSRPQLPGDCQWCTSTGAVMKLHTAHLIPWHHGTVSRGLRCFAKSEDKVPHGVGTRTNPGLGGEGQGAAPGIALGCQAK